LNKTPPSSPTTHQYGGLHETQNNPPYFEMAGAYCKAPPYRPSDRREGELLDNAAVRNKAINEFLNLSVHARKTHIFFLDADTEPVSPYAIQRLLSLDKDVVCGVTPIKLGTDKTFELGWNVQKKVGDKHENYDIDELPDKPFKIDRVGGTTVLIKRHVLEKLALKHKIFQQTEFNDDMTNIKLSEDYYFSQLLTDEGFKIWCDPLTVCHHYHNIDILDIMELFKNEPSFKNFHGFVQFNISFGDCKNHYIEVTTRKTFIDGKKNA
jgi:hypothetical protein